MHLIVDICDHHLSIYVCVISFKIKLKQKLQIWKNFFSKFSNFLKIHTKQNVYTIDYKTK